MKGRVCGNCLGVPIDRHNICVRCAETWQARPYVHFKVEHFGDRLWAIQGVHASGETSPDLMNLSTASTDHPMLDATEAEMDAIVYRMAAFLSLTADELNVVLDATAKASPVLGVKLRRALGRG